MPSIGVTGVTGFIGREFVRKLRSAGHVVHELNRKHISAAEIALPRIDSIVHLAGMAHLLEGAARNHDEVFHHANVVLTLRLAAAARAAGVSRFVFVSSAGVLGAVSPPDGFGDESPAQPYDAYTRSKWIAECELLELARDQLEVTIVRPPLVYGSGARGNFARMERGIRAGWLLPIGALSAARSVIGLRNLCDALLRAAMHEAAAGMTMLVADRHPTSIAVLGRQMAVALGRPVRQISVPANVLALGLRMIGRNSDVPRLTQPFLLRPTMARSRLGWEAPYELEDELAWTYGPEGPCTP